MLTYFPTPYPGEWWYSVLCRFHIRTGNQKYQTTIKELFEGHPRAAFGTLFPNSTVLKIVSQLPPSWNCRSVILEHTLFPYYVRMYPLSQKENMLSALCKGESVTLTHIWKATTKKKWLLRYCPLCAKEDVEEYGEAFWHREHQIPLVTVCTRHHCRLQPAREAGPRLSEGFFPLAAGDEAHRIVQEPSKPWEEPLSRILEDYLMLPLEAGPTLGYNNLAQTLMNKGYGVITSGGTLSLDAPKIYTALAEHFGAALTEEVFGSELSAFVLNRITKWNLASPERYALLQNFADLPATIMFSGEPVLEQRYIHLRNLAERGVTYGKKALAEQLGIKPFQLDTLAKKYGIKPFWEQNAKSEKKTDQIKLYMTPEEREDIHRAAQKLGFRYDSRFVKFCVEQVLRNQL